MNEENRTLLRRILAKRAAAYLSGHLHDPSPTMSTMSNGIYFTAQSGALYTGRTRWNGYGIVSLSSDNAHVRVAYRQWSERQREFCEATELSPQGVFFSTDQAKDLWKQYAPAIDRLALEEWRSSSLVPHLELTCNQGLTEESLESVFVAPEFERDLISPIDHADKTSKTESVSFDDLRHAMGNNLISGAQESGKTTILLQWAIADARETALASECRIPILLGFSEIKKAIGRMDALIR